MYTYKWLHDFAETEYKELNQKRIDIVHAITSSSAIRRKYLDSNDSDIKIKALHVEREELPEYFRRVIEKTFDGFIATLDLLELINKVPLKERIKPVTNSTLAKQGKRT